MKKGVEKEEVKEELSFEESLEKLEEIVKRLEIGDISLDKAISEFNTAMSLARICDEKLKKAEEAITKLVKQNGEVEDFEVQE